MSKIFVEETKKHSMIYGAIRALSYQVESSTSKTCQGLIKDIEPTCAALSKIAYDSPADLMNGKTVLTLKAVCAIYQNMVNKVASATGETMDINLVKEKIHEQSNILAQHQLSSKNRIAQNSKALLRDGMVCNLSSFLIDNYAARVLISGTPCHDKGGTARYPFQRGGH